MGMDRVRFREDGSQNRRTMSLRVSDKEMEANRSAAYGTLTSRQMFWKCGNGVSFIHIDAVCEAHEAATERQFESGHVSDCELDTPIRVSNS